jgi:hypothetical protein
MDGSACTRVSGRGDEVAPCKVERIKASGASQQKVDDGVRQAQRFKKMCNTHPTNTTLTFAEPFPIGLVFTAIPDVCDRSQRDISSDDASGVLGPEDLVTGGRIVKGWLRGGAVSAGSSSGATSAGLRRAEPLDKARTSWVRPVGTRYGPGLLPKLAA